MLEAEDRNDSFNYVELYLNLEKSIQRVSKSQGCIVGTTRMFAVVVESELISDDILLILNNCRKLTNERIMEHHKTVMYRELRNITADFVDANVSRLLDVVLAVANPFINKAFGVRLDVFENGEKIQTRELVFKKKKLSVTIHKRYLPKCDTGGN